MRRGLVAIFAPLVHVPVAVPLANADPHPVSVRREHLNRQLAHTRKRGR